MFALILKLISGMSSFFLSISAGSSFPPPLSRDEETKLFKKYADGDSEARQKLILHNLRLVSHIVRKYYSASTVQDDLLSIGSIGLIKAIDSFDVEKGARFATYSAKCIQNEILMYFRSQKKLSAEVSINETIDTDRDGNPLTYGDIVSTEDNIAEDIDFKIKYTQAFDYINRRLSDREKKIMVYRYGLNGNKPLTQREVATALGISRSYVSRIEKSILSDMRSYIEGNDKLY